MKRLGLAPPETSLGKAVKYTHNQWDKLIVFLENAAVPIDNNLAENDIRPFVLGRKNWLFAASPYGAQASSIIYSLIRTCVANHIDPYAYLRYLFEKLPELNSKEDWVKMLPYRIDKPSYVEK